MRWFGILRTAVKEAKQRAADIGLTANAAALFEVGFVAGVRTQLAQRCLDTARLNFLSMDGVETHGGYDAVSVAVGGFMSPTRRAIQRTNVRQAVDTLAEEHWGPDWVKHFLTWNEHMYEALDAPPGHNEWYGPHDEYWDFEQQGWAAEKPTWYIGQPVRNPATLTAAIEGVHVLDGLASVCPVDDPDLVSEIPAGTVGKIENLYLFQGQLMANFRHNVTAPTGKLRGNVAMLFVSLLEPV